MVVRVRTDGPCPRVVELAVRSTAPDGLDAAQVPAIDFRGVVDALQASVRSAEAGGAVPPRVMEPAQPDSVPDPQGSASVRQRGQDEMRRSNGNPPNISKSANSRAYRRMPEANELQTVYQRIGTVTGVAKHYGVPRHTAQGWMARLRKQESTGASISEAVKK